MRDELFDHLKHKLAETEIPDPGQGWQLMSSLLDATGRPRPVVLLRRWYAVAACLVLAGVAWAIVREIRSDERQNPTTLIGATSPAATVSPRPVHPADGPARDFATAPGASAGSAGSDKGLSSGSVSAGASGASGASGQSAVPAGAMTSAGATAGARARVSVGAMTTGTSTGGTSTSGTSASGSSIAGSSAGGTPTTAGTMASAGAPTSAGATTSAYDAAGGSLTLRGMSAPAPAYIREPVRNTLLRERPLVASLRPLAPVVGPLRPTHHGRWGLDIGLGANLPGSMRTVSVNNQTKWEPGLYPVLTTRYRLNSRLNLKVGVAAPSPVAYAKTLSQKSLSVNDTIVASYASSVSTASTKIGRLLYLDVPVSAEWTVAPHLSLEAGIQYSRLLSQQEDTRYSTSVPTGLTAYAPSTNVSLVQTSGDSQSSQVRKSDFRYLVGANYTWHRFSAGVQYQGGLRHSASQVDDQGNTIDSHTSIAKMQIRYKLW